MRSGRIRHIDADAVGKVGAPERVPNIGVEDAEVPLLDVDIFEDQLDAPLLEDLVEEVQEGSRLQWRLPVLDHRVVLRVEELLLFEQILQSLDFAILGQIVRVFYHVVEDALGEVDWVTKGLLMLNSITCPNAFIFSFFISTRNRYFKFSFSVFRDSRKSLQRICSS
jgi:hypothetical protein